VIAARTIRVGLEIMTTNLLAVTPPAAKPRPRLNLQQRSVLAGEAAAVNAQVEGR